MFMRKQFSLFCKFALACSKSEIAGKLGGPEKDRLGFELELKEQAVSKY